MKKLSLAFLVLTFYGCVVPLDVGNLTDFLLTGVPLTVTDGPDTVTCEMTITGVTVLDASCTLQSPSANKKIGCTAHSHLLDVWSCDIVVPEDSEAGTWTVSHLGIRDTVPTLTTVTRADLVADSKIVDFTVISATPDTAGPDVTAFTRAPASIDTAVGGTMTCTITATDSISTVKDASCTFVSPTGATSPVSCSTVTPVGNDWICIATVPIGAEVGTWNISNLAVRDSISNLTKLSFADVGSIPADNTFAVTSGASGTLTVDMALLPGNCTGASWNIEPGGYSGSATWGPTAVADDTYTVTWNDTAYQCLNPGTEQLTVTGNAQTFDLAPNYTTRVARSATVDICEESICTNAPPLGGVWSADASAPFAGSYTDSGTGDASLAATLYDGRGYEVTFTPESGYDPPPVASFTAQVTPQVAEGDYITTTLGDISVDMTGAPADASWTLKDSLGVVATGDTSVGPDSYKYETYTLTWEDTAFGWTPPVDEVQILSLGTTPITFGPPVP